MQLSPSLGFNLTKSLSDCYDMIDMGHADNAKAWLNYIGWLFVGAQEDNDNLTDLVHEMVVDEATSEMDAKLAALIDESKG